LSKESRRRQRAANQAGAKASPRNSRTVAAAGASVVGSPSVATRAGRRERVRAAPRQSFLERYRTAIIGLAVVAGVALIGGFVFVSATAPVFACSTEWQPEPTPTPAEGASPQPGYVQPDMGNGHVAVGSKVTYTYCPPASGKHYAAADAGPIQPRLYGPNDAVNPTGWVHNLEHGALVLLYRGDGPGATEAGQAAMRELFDGLPPTPICGFAAGTQPGPVFARFDDMEWPYAAMVWGRVLPLQEFDRDAILALYDTYAERTNPEKLCAVPSPSPGESAAPSTSPAASEPAAPSASPSPS
jgi:hypothetical protein